MQSDNDEVRSKLRTMEQEAAEKEAWLADQEERLARQERLVSHLCLAFCKAQN